MQPLLLPDPASLRAQVSAWRAEGHRVALVPTMGALHEGHVSLTRRVQGPRTKVIVSIFVNPTQFAPTEDFSKYPRTFDDDVAKLAAADVQAVYAPQVQHLYPDGFATTVTVAGPATVGLEDRFRPTHFAGVATVVCKLFTQAAPDVAIFGEKDYQQLMVIRQMARDLDLPVEVLAGATIREPDGLAMSSRNRYLSPQDRQTAAVIPQVTGDVAAAIRAGRDPIHACAGGLQRLTQAGFAVDYLEARDAATLAVPGDGATRALRLLVAARLGATRLIDNIAV